MSDFEGKADIALSCIGRACAGWGH